MLTGIAAIALSLSTSAAAGTWALAPAEGINVHAGHLAAARQVLKGHLEELGQRVTVLAADEGDPVAAARERGASAVVREALTRLGQKVKVTVTLEPLDGSAPRSAGLDAGSPDDLDPVLLRLARFLVQGAPVQEPRVGEVTDVEEAGAGRKAATTWVGLAITGATAGAGGSQVMLSGVSAYWLYDARAFLADVQAGFAVTQGRDASGGWTGVTIAALRPFGDRDLTPFAGAGVGFVHLDVNGRSGSGLELFGDLGVLLGRTNTVHLRADLKPFVTTFDLSTPTASAGIGAGVHLAVGVGF